MIWFHRLSRNLCISGPHQDISDGGRTASLSIVFAFNKSDWASIGWANYLEGKTIIY